MARRFRTSIDKQENVVSILWDFARNLQQNPEYGCVSTLGDGTRVSLDHIGKALLAIMDNFGYATKKVQ